MECLDRDRDNLILRDGLVWGVGAVCEMLLLEDAAGLVAFSGEWEAWDWGMAGLLLSEFMMRVSFGNYCLLQLFYSADLFSAFVIVLS